MRKLNGKFSIMNTFKENPISRFKFISISPGRFTMGSPKNEVGRFDDENQVEIELTEPFEMQETQVTQLQWHSIMETDPSGYEGIQKPVHNVSWFDAQEFCAKLNELDSKYIYRLPTEAEWEYCCRAGTETAYSCLNNRLEDYACFNSDGPSSVKNFKPNPWGLYDMHGNVWEWCEDAYSEELPDGKNSLNKLGSHRVIRGGSWINFYPRLLRSAIRGGIDPGLRFVHVGFRLVRNKVSLGSRVVKKCKKEKRTHSGFIEVLVKMKLFKIYGSDGIELRLGMSFYRDFLIGELECAVHPEQAESLQHSIDRVNSMLEQLKKLLMEDKK
jgi:formylglycine-generating enzyme